MPLFGAWTTANGATAQAATLSQPAWTSTTSSTGLGLAQLYAQAQATQTQAAHAAWYLAQQARSWTALASTTSSTWTGTYFYVGDELVDHSQYMALAQQRVIHCRERTEEERIAQEIVRAEIAARHERRRREYEAAHTRSRELLLAHLTPEQRETFETRNWFVVQGGRTRTRYRIRTTGYTHNIEVLRGPDTVSHRLCAHCAGNIPLHDHHLTQKLSLESDEDYFLSIANRSAA